MASIPPYGAAALQSRQWQTLTGTWTPQTYPAQTDISVAPADWAVTLAEAKQFLRLSSAHDDNYVALLVEGISEQIERYIGMDTYIRTRRSYWERAGWDLELPYGPHGTISSVVSIDEDGTETTLTVNSDYYVQGMTTKRIRLLSGIAGGSFIRVTYESGYAANECPYAIRAAILQELSLQYKNRQDSNTPSRVSVNGLSLEARHLLLPYMSYSL